MNRKTTTPKKKTQKKKTKEKMKEMMEGWDLHLNHIPKVEENKSPKKKERNRRLEKISLAIL